MEKQIEQLLKPFVNLLLENDYDVDLDLSSDNKMIFNKLINFTIKIPDNILSQDRTLSIPIVEKPKQLLEKYGITLDTVHHFYQRTDNIKKDYECKFNINVRYDKNEKKIVINYHVHSFGLLTITDNENQIYFTSKNWTFINVNENINEKKDRFKDIFDIIENNNMNICKYIESKLDTFTQTEIHNITNNQTEYEQVIKENKVLSYLIGALYQYDVLQNN